jgi:hypothetical protein
MNLALLILIGGVLHFGILIASVCVPRVLDWKNSLAVLDPLSRQVIWVHGVFLALVIVAFGALSVALSSELASGSPLARAICLFIGLFWATRLAVQFLVFDAKPHLSNPLLKVGYNGLTAVFVYHSVVYSIAAFQ